MKCFSLRRRFPSIQKGKQMEDLWFVQDSAIEVDEYADAAEYKRFLERFRDNEEQSHRSRLLFGTDPTLNNVRTGNAS